MNEVISQISPISPKIKSQVKKWTEDDEKTEKAQKEASEAYEKAVRGK
jgi:hypothetical protein